jgi:metallophosphoesterase (TIGR00282 family)
LRILFIGDIVGEPGRKIVERILPRLVQQHKIDCVIANGENAAGGFGITPKIADQFFKTGIHVITGGNHIWDKKEIYDYISTEPRLLRPANYPAGVPGKGSLIFTIDTFAGGAGKIAVLHLLGRAFMFPTDCPFKTADREIEEIRKETRTILVDFHGEATSEKKAIGWYLDGRVSAVVGTHTHVQTADEEVLPQGTAYITDVGMTGPTDSVIGVKKEIAIKKFLTQVPQKFEPADGPAVLSGVIIETAPGGASRSIQRLQIAEQFDG